MTSVRRALALSLAERYLLVVLALTGNIILARLLTPEQIGIYSVTLALIGIAQVLRDFGIGNFLIQEKNLSEEHVRTALGLSLLLGSALFVIVFLAAPLISRFYGEASMVATVRIVSINFLLLPFCTISLSLLRRDMQFQRLLYVSISAAAAGLFITLVLAFADWGQDSMAIGAVATNAVTGFAAWLARTDRRLLLPSLNQWRAMFSFGSQSTAAGIVTTISMDINDLALGRILGFAPVAMISRAQGLMNLFHRDFMGAIRNVAFPAFAAAHRSGDNLESRYIQSVTTVTVIAWPFYGFVGLFAIEILRVLYGPQWDEAAPLVPLFCLAGAVAAIAILAINAILAVGRVDLMTASELIFQPFRAVVIVVTAMATRSLWACAAAYAVTWMIYVPLIYAFKQRCIPNDYGVLLRSLWSSACVAVLALAGPLLVAWLAGLSRVDPIGTGPLAIAVVTAVLGWFAGLVIFKHALARDPLFQRLIRRLRRAS